MILVEQRNPFLIEAVNKAMYFDRYLKELREHVYFYMVNSTKLTYEQVEYMSRVNTDYRVSQIKSMFGKSSMVSDDFYKLTHKTMPLDVAVDVNIKMAKYLLEESITMNEYVFEVEEGVNWHFKRDFYGNLR